MSEITESNSQDSSNSNLNSKKVGGWFYLIYSLLLFTTVIVGFGPTFFVRPFFENRSLHWSLVIHGIVTTCWFLLLVVQAGLLKLRSVKRHRQIGIAGWWLIGAVFVTGLPAAIGLGARLVEAGLQDNSDLYTADHWAQIARDSLLFALFASVAIAGLIYRKRIEVHKRFLLLASVVLTTPGLARLSQFKIFQWVPEPLGFLGSFAILLLLPASRDRFVDGQIHPILKWGGPLVFLTVFVLLLLPEII